MAERFRNGSGRVGSVSQCPGPGVHLLAYRRIDPEGSTVARDDPAGQAGNAGAMDALGAGIFAARLKPQPLVLDVLPPLEQIACDGNRAFVQVALCYQHRHAGQRVARCGLNFDVIRQSVGACKKKGEQRNARGFRVLYAQCAPPTPAVHTYICIQPESTRPALTAGGAMKGQQLE
uniref:Uncharacterized protein n=1 Tax=Anopheles merus TaxID=30066 RepID=A0A182VBK8_ANOME